MKILFYLMNILINFFKCSNIIQRIRIIEEAYADMGNFKNYLFNINDIPDKIIYPDCVRVVNEKDFKNNVSIFKYSYLVLNS
jgi:hypothetical protein